MSEHLKDIPGLSPSHPPDIQMISLKVFISQLNQCIRNKCKTKQSQRKYMSIYQVYKGILDWPKEKLDELFVRHINNLKAQIRKIKLNDALKVRFEKVSKDIKDKGVVARARKERQREKEPQNQRDTYRNKYRDRGNY